MNAVGDSDAPRGEALDLRGYIRPVWRWKWIVLVIAIIAAGGTYAFTSREQKTYTATTSVYVLDPDPAASVAGGSPSGPPSQQQLLDVATLFTGQTITNAVYRELNLPVGAAGSVVVAPQGTSSFIYVTASSHSPALAARLANTYVSVFLGAQAASVVGAAHTAATAATTTLRTIRNTPANQAERASLLSEIAQYDTLARNPTSGAQQIDRAVAPTAPSAPKPARDAVFAGVIGLLLGIGLAFALDLADRRLTRVSSVESLYGRSVMAVLPHVSKPAPKVDGRPSTPPEFVEVMRGLRVNLRLTGDGNPPQSVIVTSGLPAEGKSTVARDLAFAYADAGERVLLIDCDLRRPSLAQMFGVTPKLGLVQVLRREAGPAEAALTVFRTNPASTNGAPRKRIAAGDPRLDGSIALLAHGERVQNPIALLSSQRMRELLATATTLFDTVILDTSPILTVSDAVPLLDRVGAVLFVARLGMTTRESAARLTELARRVPNMNLVGVVVNGMRERYMDEGYGYYAQYGYGYGSDAPAEASARTTSSGTAAVAQGPDPAA